MFTPYTGDMFTQISGKARHVHVHTWEGRGAHTNQRQGTAERHVRTNPRQGITAKAKSIWVVATAHLWLVWPWECQHPHVCLQNSASTVSYHGRQCWTFHPGTPARVRVKRKYHGDASDETLFKYKWSVCSTVLSDIANIMAKIVIETLLQNKVLD